MKPGNEGEEKMTREKGRKKKRARDPQRQKSMMDVRMGKMKGEREKRKKNDCPVESKRRRE